MHLLIAVFLMLLTAWLLWAWIIAEDRGFRLMKLWCARGFVVMAAVLCVAGGAWWSRRSAEQQHRESVTQFMQQLHQRAKSGQINDVLDSIQHVAEIPDERSLHSLDILARITEVSTALEKSERLAEAAQRSRH